MLLIIKNPRDNRTITRHPESDPPHHPWVTIHIFSLLAEKILQYNIFFMDKDPLINIFFIVFPYIMGG